MIQSVRQRIAKVYADIANALDVTLGDALSAVKTTTTGAVATTQHQVNEEDASVFRFMTAAQIAAITAETGAAGAVCSAALQAALDGNRAGAMLGLNRYPVGTYQLDAPLLIKSGTRRLTLRGDNRVRCILQPNAVSIATAPVNVNALFVNQDNNPHFCIENVRMTATNGYTGIGIYCVENGGADASGQCIFSGIFRNLWVDFGTTNSGFLTGATQNTVFDTITFENMKGCFTLQGVGNGDNFYTNISLYNCYDQFILQTADTNGAFAMTVRGLHAYSHNRGRLFDVQNWSGGSVSDVYLEPSAGNLGDTGIGRFKSCTGTLLSQLYALTRAGVPACAVGLEFDTFRGKVHEGAIVGDIGLRLSGTGTMDLEVNGVDFSGCTTAALQFFGNFPGTVRTRNCKFNSSQGYCAVFQVAGSTDWYSTDDEFVDAGLGGNAGYRNIALASSGKVVLTRPRIGRTTGGAAALYWIDATGTGTVDIYDPIYIGTPPGAVLNPGNTQTVNIHISPASGVRTVTAAADTVADSDYDLIFNRAGTVTETLPAPGSYIGRCLVLRTIQAQAVVSASANVVPLTGGAAGTAILSAVAGKWARLKSDGAAWQIMEAN
jgi:hypothetical protein